MKTAIMTDSTFYMSKEVVEQYNIVQVPLMVNFEDKTFKEDQYNIEEVREIFDIIDTRKVLPKSSQPSAGDYITRFEELVRQGFDRILLFTISSHISGTFDGAVTASNMFMEDNDVEILVYDTLSIGNAAGFIVIDVAKELIENPDLSKDKILEIVEWHKEKSIVYLVVEDLKYMAYGGRIPKSLAKVGNVLRIKPVLSVKQGIMDEHCKARSKKNGVKMICELVGEYTKDLDVPIYIAANQLFAEEELEMYFPSLLKSANTETIEIPNALLGPVVGIHTGPGTLGFGWTIPFKYKNK